MRSGMCPVRRTPSHGGIGVHQETQTRPSKGPVAAVAPTQHTKNHWHTQETLVQHGPRGLCTAKQGPFQFPIQISIYIPIQVRLSRLLQLQEWWPQAGPSKATTAQGQEGAEKGSKEPGELGSKILPTLTPNTTTHALRT